MDRFSHQFAMILTSIEFSLFVLVALHSNVLCVPPWNPEINEWNSNTNHTSYDREYRGQRIKKIDP